MVKKVVLAYSGGLDTSVMVKWIQEHYGSEVVTVTLDVGQGKDLKAIEEKAWMLGVVNHYSIDAREEFVNDYVVPAIKANALYMDAYPVSSSLSRPLIASKLVEVAEKEGADAVAHGCTGKGNDQVRFDITIKSLNPDLRIIAPVREWNMTRDKEIEWAKEHGVPVPVTADSPYSIDQNLWGRSIECGIIEHPDVEPPEEVFEWTAPIEETPDEPEYITIGFEEGAPASLNGEEMTPLEIIEEVQGIAGKHGVGRIDHMEDRIVGLKSREVYEAPAATVILKAHADLEKMVLTRHEKLFKRHVDHEWAVLVYTGLWMDPLKEALDAFIEKTQERVTGEVTVKLFKGNAQVVGRSSPSSLYDLSLATYDITTTFDQTAAIGFIELWGLPTVTYWALKRKQGRVPLQQRTAIP
ncbi:argininosuccinate synthase [Candidatus Bathyarchaeota archaeon]|nr:argininosuccinate synthase [Candidatus Bathyarchaeota archaeon]RJS89359.1 MAG: argininosuccinate synthase [Candidatus Bathyarchaeota archaeon]